MQKMNFENNRLGKYLFFMVFAVALVTHAHAEECSKSNITGTSIQSMKAELKNQDFPLNYYAGPGYGCKKILRLKSGVEELGLYGVDGEWAAVKILKPEVQTEGLLWIKKSELKPFKETDVSAEATQNRRSALVPVRKRNDRTHYDYTKALVIKDVRIFRDKKRPTTDFFTEGEFVSVHGKASTGNHIDAIYYVSGWSRDKFHKEAEGLIAGSALKLLNVKEYSDLFDEIYPVYERKADAIKRTKLYSAPGKKRTKFNIGPKNKYGGDKDLDVMRHTIDENWFLVRYWTGELGGYRQGWVPRGTINVHLTVEEIKAQAREAAERDRLAKLKEETRLAEDRARQIEERNKRAEKERARQIEESNRREAEKLELEAENRERQKAMAMARAIIKPYIKVPEQKYIQYVASNNISSVDILAQPDPFSEVVYKVPAGNEIIVFESTASSWLTANYSGVKGFIDENQVAVKCDSVFSGYIVKLGQYTDIVDLANILKEYEEAGLDHLMIRTSEMPGPTLYTLGVGPFSSIDKAKEVLGSLKMMHDISGANERNSIPLVKSAHKISCK